MARCLLCLFILAIQAAAGSLETGFAVRFMKRKDNIKVHVRDRTVSDCDPKQQYTPVNLYKHDILVVSVDTDSRACLVNSTAFSEPFNLDNDTYFARLALEGWAVNVTTGNTLFNISLACDDSNINMTVEVMTLNAPGDDMEQCCAGTDPQHDWCHRCGKGQYREGLRCHPCLGDKTTPRTGVFTKDNCICPEGYKNADDKCEKCEQGKFSEIQDHENEGCQSCNNTQLSTGPRATVCPETTPNATNTTVQTYQATQYLRPRQKKCGKECCVPGEYWDAALERCQNCVDGYNYSDTRGAITCESCDMPLDGHEILGCFDGQGSEQKCKKGYYRERGDANPFCMPCPPRKTTASVGSNSETSCMCEEGYIKHGENGCTACQVGKYKQFLSGDECIQCPQHKTTRSQGSTTIEDCVCEYGFYGQNGDALCSRCERRQYQDELGRDKCEECELCLYRGYATGCGGANKGSCEACSNCPGAADGERCDFCGICNFNKTYSVDSLKRSTWFNQTVDKCGVCGGNITEENKYETCHKCPAGTTGEDGPRVCNQTESNRGDGVQYEDIVDASQCRVCDPCAKGTFKNISGGETCQKCPKGKYANDTGLTACYDCEANKTTDAEGSIGVNHCVCDMGYSHAPGTNISGTHACLRCEPGTFNIHLNHHVCSNCSAGEYNDHSMPDSTSCRECRQNTYSYEGAAECVPCENSMTIDAGSPNIESCICNAGYVGTDSGHAPCSACEAGKYQPDIGRSECLNCLAGNFSTGAAVACEVCPEHHWSDDGAHLCKKCAAVCAEDAAKNTNITGLWDNYDSGRPKETGYVQFIPYAEIRGCGSGPGNCDPDACEGHEIVGVDHNVQSSTIMEVLEPFQCATMPYKPGDRVVYNANTQNNLATVTEFRLGYSGNGLHLGGNLLTFAEFYDVYVNFDHNGNTLGVNLENLECVQGRTCGCDVKGRKSVRFVCDYDSNKKWDTLLGCLDCPPCEAGKFATVSGVNKCDDCPTGTYSAAPGASQCDGCVPGTYASTSGLSACTNCSAGSYSAVFNATSADNCTLCARGSYSAVAGASECTQCARGSYADVEGKVACDLCRYWNMPLRLFSDHDLWTQSVNLLKREIVNETTCNTGSKGVEMCCFGVHAIPGFQTTATDTIEYKQELCCTGTSNERWSSDTNVGVHEACTNEVDNECIFQCEYGKFKQDDFSSSCTECAAGKYKDNALVAVAECTSCAQYLGSRSGSSACYNCEAGKVVNNENVCEDCASGKYRGVFMRKSVPQQTSDMVVSETATSDEPDQRHNYVHFHLDINIPASTFNLLDIRIHSKDTMTHFNQPLSRITIYLNKLKVLARTADGASLNEEWLKVWDCGTGSSGYTCASPNLENTLASKNTVDDGDFDYGPHCAWDDDADKFIQCLRSTKQYFEKLEFKATSGIGVLIQNLHLSKRILEIEGIIFTEPAPSLPCKDCPAGSSCVNQ